MKTLLTGDAGYIAAQVLCALDAAGREPVVIDDYVNGPPSSLERVSEILGRAVEAYELDIRGKPGLDELLADGDIDSVIHHAGLKAVGESVEQPERDYENKVSGTRVLVDALQRSNVRNFVFSSSATVYDVAENMPIDGSTPLFRKALTDKINSSQTGCEEMRRDAWHWQRKNPRGFDLRSIP